MGSKKKIIVIVIGVIIISIIVGLIYFVLKIKKENLVPEYKPERLILVGEAKNNFNSYLNLPSSGGKFLEFDEINSEISAASLDTETMKISTKIFKIDEHTIFSKMTFAFNEFKLFPKEDLRKISRGTQIIFFYSKEEKEIPLAKLVMVEDIFQSALPQTIPSLPQK